MSQLVATGIITIIDVNDGSPGPVITLSASRQTFAAVDGVISADVAVFASGVFAPDVHNEGQADIVFTATKQNLTGSTTWTTSPAVTLTSTSNTSATLTYLNFGSCTQVIVTATDVTSGLSASSTILKLNASTSQPLATQGAPAGTTVGGQEATALVNTAATGVTNAAIAQATAVASASTATWAGIPAGTGKPVLTRGTTASLPSSPTVGMFYYDTDLKIQYYCETAGSWVVMSGVLTIAQVNAAGITADNIQAGTITGSTLQTDTGTVGHYERFVVDIASKSAKFYDSANNLAVWIGTAVINSILAYGCFGNSLSGNSRNGVYGVSYSGKGAYGYSYTGSGVYGETYYSGHGVVGKQGGQATSTGYAGVYGVDNGTTSDTYGVLGYSYNSVGLSGSSGLGYGIVAQCESSAKAPLKIVPSSASGAPTTTADSGSFWVSSAGVLYFRSGSTWKIVNLT